MNNSNKPMILIMIMYSYHVLINALSTHMIHINLNMMFCTPVEHSPSILVFSTSFVLFFT